jgi:SARP family transcriptional regulator, regulator of embCAB operon
LWGERPPASAVNALQAHVSALRRVLDPEWTAPSPDGLLITRPPGYLLRIEDEALDTIRFERLAARGRDALATDPAGAAGMLREALALWRGPAITPRQAAAG